jgi:hypothetical protein
MGKCNFVHYKRRRGYGTSIIKHECTSPSDTDYHTGDHDLGRGIVFTTGPCATFKLSVKAEQGKVQSQSTQELRQGVLYSLQEANHHAEAPAVCSFQAPKAITGAFG